MADFITECTSRLPVGKQEDWELQVDDFSTKTRCGTGLVIKPPGRKQHGVR